MLVAENIVARMAQKLEDYNFDLYDRDKVVIPALNEAMGWIMAIITPHLRSGKYVEELFREISHVAVFQTNKFGRISIDPDALGKNVWTIVSVRPKPWVTIVNSSTLSELPYFSKIQKYIGSEVYNKPIIKIKIDFTSISEPGGVPLGDNLSSGGPISSQALKDHESIFRPELAFLRSDNVAEHMAYDSAHESWNQFEAGSKKNAQLFGRYSYTEARNYGSITVGGYNLNYSPEIDILPKEGHMLVAVGFIEAPVDIDSATDLSGQKLSIPDKLENALLQKAMSVIFQDEGDQNMYSISEREVVSLISAV